MKKIINYCFVLVLLTTAGCASSKFHRGNYEYDQMAYHKAAQNYTAFLAKEDHPLAVIRLADCYYKMHDYKNAEFWYGKAVALEESTPSDKLAYATVLKINGKYQEARNWYARYLLIRSGDEAAMAAMASCDSIEEYTRNASLYQVKPLNLDANVNSFGMIPFEGGYVFCSERAANPKVKTNPWNGHAYLSILYSRMLPDGNFTAPVSFSNALNSPYHNGPVAFSPAYDKVYFSRSSCMNGKPWKNADNINNIKLYSASKVGNDWGDITELPFNSENYSCSQPALSADGKTLFFVSDKPGGYGGTDIYMSTFEHGHWTASKNLGKEINTTGAEMFPCYHRDAEGHAFLYFSTDGMQGMGGLDLYCSAQQADGSWGKPVHLDAPFNSSRDDFAITFNADGTSGYFSSSRENDIDKLYKFNLTPKFLADGVVYNKKTNELIPDAQVSIVNSTTGEKAMVTTDANGKFTVPMESSSEYTFGASKEKFLPGSPAYASTMGKRNSETIFLRIGMDPEEIPQVAIQMPNIYYDFDKYNIRADAKAALDKVFEDMLYNPEMKLEIGAHADSRGTEKYNMALTQKRAMSVVDYLTSRGISKDRITAHWYGKSRPVNECRDGVNCPPEKHQENRRSEFNASASANSNLTKN